jgi:hypothetical protein
MLLLSLAFAPASHAVLQAVGGVDPATTFPAWYQDSTGLSLAPCFDANGFCPITMAAGPGFTGVPPIVFPLNFPEEGFYFYSDTTAGTTLYIAALEFAFAAVVRAGDQVTFARIRIRDKTAPAGTYTITHPYGVDIIDVDAAAVAAGRGMFFTEDVGFAAGVFTGALAGRIGPFLRSAGGLITSPDGNIYIGNGVTPTAVTGTPVTSVTVAGPISGTSSLFIVEGKVIGMSVTPTTIAFPVQRPNFDSLPVTVTVTNLSQAAPLALAAIAIQGTNPADFHLAADTCSNASVPASTLTVPGTCTFNVVFNSPTAVSGARTASILISGTLALVPKSTIAPVTGLIDAQPPSVTAHFPDVATMPANVAVTATFDEAMLLSSLTNTTFTVLSNGTEVPGAWELDAAKTTAAFIPVAFYPEGNIITAATTTFVTDIAGNGLLTALTFSFTATAADLTPPAIASVTPADNDTGVRTDAPITVAFNEQMLSSSVTSTSIRVQALAFVDENGQTVPAQDVAGTLTLANDAVTNKAIATFTPAAALAFGRSYTVTVGTGATAGAQDLMRNALTVGQTAKFVTNFQPSAPEVVSPANAATGVARPVILHWKRSSDSDPTDVIAYHLFLCNNPSFIGTAPNCIQNVPITPVAAQAKGVYYASVAGGSMLFTLFGLSFAAGIKGRKKILLMIAVLVVSGLFIVSCSKSDDGAPAPAPVSTDVTFQVDGLSPNVTYFWKLEADDGKGGVATTRVMTFSTQ